MAADLTLSALKGSYGTWDATRIATDTTFYVPFGPEDLTPKQTDLATGGGGGPSPRPSTGRLYPRAV